PRAGRDQQRRDAAGDPRGAAACDGVLRRAARRGCDPQCRRSARRDGDRPGRRPAGRPGHRGPGHGGGDMTRPLAVGFIGIGTMGWPMAANLVKAGHAVTVLDADAARAARFAAEHGATAAADAATLGRTVDVVVTMLPDGRQVRQAITGASAGGASLLSALKPGSVVVDMSSSDPVGTRELGAVLREAGVRLVDAPVSGLAPKAQAGTLTIMVGADDDADVERVRPLLEAMGERLFRCGTLGCGHAMKALNNVVAATAFTAT